MLILSTDIETTGLDVETCQILEVGAVLQSEYNQPIEEMPKFHTYVVHPVMHGDPYALFMNSEILRRIAKREEPYLYSSPDEVAPRMAEWLKQNNPENKKITPAGKNVAGFDLPFLRKLPKFKELIKLYHRTFDPAILYLRFEDEEIPSLATCIERAKISGEVTHTALEDALLVIKLIKNSMYCKWLEQ